MKIRVCSYAELEAEGKRAVVADRKAVVIVRARDGRVYALRDVCPHKGPCLSAGMIDRGCAGERVGVYVYEPEVEVLRCPWHSWEFDIRTGRSLFAPERVKVKTYPVTVEDGDIYVEVQ
ncbi:Rieske (2Fe-2S) protein [Paenibacillus sp. IB182496]|uniref:Rieske (2Fe-2S) protein n=1 Tax=Paenibacillus sabuli TaxID=2772509 RepID=A0A927GSR7_9BACL|nr:Rieske (2Fe-2S) protein [Paenibacillus sabuli]MBD2846315.1 Rieske (2Fe-2S) protein [Paenibacillus sabuli]